MDTFFGGPPNAPIEIRRKKFVVGLMTVDSMMETFLRFAMIVCFSSVRRGFMLWISFGTQTRERKEPSMEEHEHTRVHRSLARTRWL